MMRKLLAGALVALLSGCASNDPPAGESPGREAPVAADVLRVNATAPYAPSRVLPGSLYEFGVTPLVVADENDWHEAVVLTWHPGMEKWDVQPAGTRPGRVDGYAAAAGETTYLALNFAHPNLQGEVRHFGWVDWVEMGPGGMRVEEAPERWSHGEALGVVHGERDGQTHVLMNYVGRMSVWTLEGGAWTETPIPGTHPVARSAALALHDGQAVVLAPTSASETALYTLTAPGTLARQVIQLEPGAILPGRYLGTTSPATGHAAFAWYNTFADVLLPAKSFAMTWTPAGWTVVPLIVDAVDVPTAVAMADRTPYVFVGGDRNRLYRLDGSEWVPCGKFDREPSLLTTRSGVYVATRIDAVDLELRRMDDKACPPEGASPPPSPPAVATGGACARPLAAASAARQGCGLAP